MSCGNKIVSIVSNCFRHITVTYQGYNYDSGLAYEGYITVACPGHNDDSGLYMKDM